MSEAGRRGSSSPTTAASRSAARTTSAKQLAADPQFVFRLKRKLSQLFCEKAANGVITLDPEFVHADRCVNDDNYRVDLWGLKQFLHSCGSATRSLSERDIEVLFDVVRSEGRAMDDGTEDAEDSGADEPSSTATIDLAEVLLWLRKLFHCTSQQFHAILKRIRAKQLDVNLCTFAKRYRKLLAKRAMNGGGSSSPMPLPVSRSEVFEFLTGAGALTHSEAFLFLDYCSVSQPVHEPDDDFSSDGDRDAHGHLVPKSAPHRPALPKLDMDFIIAAIFEFPLPDDIAFPLLMTKFVEALSDPYRAVSGTGGETFNRSGIAGIYDGLKKCDLRESPIGDQSGDSEDTETVTDEEIDREKDDGRKRETPAEEPLSWFYVPNIRMQLDEAQFRRLNTFVCGGLPTKECDLLFSFLCDRRTGLMSVSVLLEQYVLRLDPVPPTELDLWAANVRGTLLEHMPNGLNGLHLRLARFGTRRIPVVDLSQAIRECGVPVSAAPDAVLDALVRQAPTCGSFVLLLRGALPPSRTAVIRKLFAMLDTNGDGLVSRDLVFSCFNVTGNGTQQGAEFGRARDWKADLMAFLESLPHGDSLSFAEFEYYWGNVAASVADDNTFTMLLWKAYSMHKPPATGSSPNSRAVTPSRSRRGDGTPTQQEPSAQPGRAVAAPVAAWNSYCLPQERSPGQLVSRRLLR